jgi:hypothetical protein
MANIILALIEKTSKKPFIFLLLGVFILLNILMNTPGLPTSTPSMQAISPTFTPFDLQASGYTAATFTADLDRLGQSGRDIYRNFSLLDIFFPAAYALTLASFIYLIFHQRRNWLRWLFLIPICTGLLDYVENVFIAIAFSGYPSPNSTVVALASAATQAKMIFNALLVLSLLLTLITWVGSLFGRK